MEKKLLEDMGMGVGQRKRNKERNGVRLLTEMGMGMSEEREMKI